MRTAFVRVDHSRPRRLAEAISSKSKTDLQTHLDDSTVLVSLDDAIPNARLTAKVLLTTLRRGPGRIMIDAGELPHNFLDELVEAATLIDPDRGISVIRGNDAMPERAVAIHIGLTAPRPAIRIAPDGYGAHIASSMRETINLSRPGNSCGAVYTAALGAAEVFKFNARVVRNRRTVHRHLQFCPLTLSSDLSLAPELTEVPSFDLTLIGVGAIGTGIVLLLDALRAQGRLVVVDPQTFGHENVATYSLGGFADAEESVRKVDLAKRSLPRFDVLAEQVTAAELIQLIDRKDVRWSPVVLTALDSPEARRDAQRLWPDRLIDAQTGDTMLGIYDHAQGVDPCMICHFGVDRSKPSGAIAVADRLGLSHEKLADPDALLVEEDLLALQVAQREILRPHLGTPLCGLAQAIGLTSLDSDDYMPSIPFVSLQAACLSIGRLLAHHLDGKPRLPNLVQYDGLYGPQTATFETMRPKPDCICQTRSDSIKLTRESRAAV